MTAWDRFLAAGYTCRVRARDLLWDQDQPVPGIYLVISGLVGLYRDRIDCQIPVAFIKPGEWVFDPALLDGGKTSRRAEAWQNGQLLFWGLSTWRHHASGSPEILRQILRFLVRQLCEQEKRILHLSCGSAAQRIAHVLEWLMQTLPPDTPLSVSRVSTFAGVSRESVYRCAKANPHLHGLLLGTKHRSQNRRLPAKQPCARLQKQQSV